MNLNNKKYREVLKRTEAYFLYLRNFCPPTQNITFQLQKSTYKQTIRSVIM